MGGLPEVYFDRSFVDFVKDNFSRLLRAIDRDPGMEVPVIANGVQKGISREMVDSLRSQLEEKNKLLLKAEEDLLSVGRQLGQEQADHRRAKETAAVEVSRIKNVNDALHRHHEEELSKLRATQTQLVADHQRQLEHAQRTFEANADRTRRRVEAEISDLRSNIDKLEADLAKADKNHIQDLQTAHEEYTNTSKEQSARLQRADEKVKELEARVNAATLRATNAEQSFAKKETERQAAQSELDDLLMVFGDLEEKATKYKAQLKALGESVSDGEADEDEDDDDVD